MTMLDRMRRHKNILKWSLAVVVLTFVLLYIPDFVSTGPAGTGAAPGEVVADVGGRELTVREFQQRYISQIQAYRNQFGGNINNSLLRQLGVDRQILSQMVEEQVALIEAERHGIRVTDDELAQQILSIPGLQENGQFIGEARYQQLLQTQNPPMTASQFEEGLRRSLIVEKLRAALTDWMAVADADLEREYTQRNEKVKLQVVALTADRFRDKVTVTDADVAAHFASHSAEYRRGEQRKIRYLLLDRDQARQKVVVPPTDIQRYYNDNIQQYTTPEQIRASHILLETAGKNDADVKKRAEEILKQVKSGADFAALAKKVSEDKGSTANGGDLDYFGAWPHGARVRAGGLRDAARADQRSGEVAVRLSHHQGGRQARRLDASARGSPGADSAAARDADCPISRSRTGRASWRSASTIPATSTRWPRSWA